MLMGRYQGVRLIRNVTGEGIFAIHPERVGSERECKKDRYHAAGKADVTISSRLPEGFSLLYDDYRTHKH